MKNRVLSDSAREAKVGACIKERKSGGYCCIQHLCTLPDRRIKDSGRIATALPCRFLKKYLNKKTKFKFRTHKKAKMQMMQPSRHCADPV